MGLDAALFEVASNEVMAEISDFNSLVEKYGKMKLKIIPDNTFLVHKVFTKVWIAMGTDAQFEYGNYQALLIDYPVNIYEVKPIIQMLKRYYCAAFGE